MIKEFFGKVKNMLGKLFAKQELKGLNADIAMSDAMENAITLWSAMYENKAPWLDKDTRSLNLAAAIASETARMVTLEFESQITGSTRADYLNVQYEALKDLLRYYAEYGCAKGGIAFKPYVSGENISVDAVQADCFFPTAYDSSGNITGAIFVERVCKGSMFYTRLERHEMIKNGVKITNKAYVSRDVNILGSEIPLERVEQWADITPEAEISNVDRPLFAYYKVAQANTVDATSPLGVSIYTRAVDLIREADKQYSRLLWENEGGELAIDADVTMFKNIDGKLELPQGKERLFRHYKNFADAEGGKSIQIFSPNLRDASLINSLNQILMRIEDTVGLARGTFSDAQNQAKTATELKMMKQRTYCLVSDNQKALEKALRDYVYAVNTLADIYNLAPKGEYEISFKWDDSIITDKDAEREKLLQEVSAGIISPVIYLAQTRGITEEEAKKLLPEMQALTDDITEDINA